MFILCIQVNWFIQGDLPYPLHLISTVSITCVRDRVCECVCAHVCRV